MINQTSFDLNTTYGRMHLTIIPIIQTLPNGDFYQTGVYKLMNGSVGMGSITFTDEDMAEWQYDGIGELMYNEAERVANFIRNYKDPAGANPAELQG
jgi:hypothetical protein